MMITALDISLNDNSCCYTVLLILMMAVADDKFDYPKFAMAQNMAKTADENVKYCNYVRIFFRILC